MKSRKPTVTAIMALAAASLVATSSASANPGAAPATDGLPPQSFTDNLPHPLADRQAELRQEALQSIISGQAKGVAKDQAVAQVTANEYVELENVDVDLIWTTLGEYPNKAHNTIPEPDRSVDNSTIWEDDFSEQYYEKLLFNPRGVTMSNYYLEMSQDTYTVQGDVTPWAEMPEEAATYGSTDPCGGIVCSNVWNFVDDSIDGWWDNALAGGMTADELNDYLADFDVWDRYDHDGDGNFDEPDGYIDHYQAVHSGQGAETGGGELGTDAIWSHRWYAQLTAIGDGGPTTPDGTVTNYGGTQIGDSDYWVGDYTVEPENGGVGVFAHEFGHDLGLPDLYDTSGNTCGSACENSTGFWTLMSSGSYGNDGTEDIGSKPTHMGAWEKFQLGWLDYEVAFAGESSYHKLGPSTGGVGKAQAVFVVLPEKEITEEIGTPYAGEAFYYSGQGNDLDNLMYAPYDLPAGASLTAQVDYDIELDWDYAYLVASTDAGETWEEVETSESTDTDPNGQNFGYGITGESGGWTELTADLSAYEGEVWLGFRYWTDVAAVERGFSVDEIAVTGADTLGAEGDEGVIFEPADGFRATSGSETALYPHYYLAENRSYKGTYDTSLRDGPYNFGFLDQHEDLVEHFPYQDGVLIDYWDTSQSDNSTSAHPGEGLLLPVDAHPDPLYDATGAPWRSRIQSYDSTFGLEDTDEITLHQMSQPSSHGGLNARPGFNDTQEWWNPETPTSSVDVPRTGTAIRILNQGPYNNHVRLQVKPAATIYGDEPLMGAQE